MLTGAELISEDRSFASGSCGRRMSPADCQDTGRKLDETFDPTVLGTAKTITVTKARQKY